jgi:hypothetical protein
MNPKSIATSQLCKIAIALIDQGAGRRHGQTTLPINTLKVKEIFEWGNLSDQSGTKIRRGRPDCNEIVMDRNESLASRPL